MSPVAVFVRTLLKSSAIFVGAAAVFLHPSLEWRGPARTQAAGTAVGAQQSGTEGAVDALIAALKDSDAGVRRAAAHALADLNSRRAAPALADAMKGADPELRATIVSALGELGDSSVAPALRDALKDESASVRARAASALGEIGDRGSVDALIAAVKDKSADVRKRAVSALGEIGDARARRRGGRPRRCP